MKAALKDAKAAPQQRLAPNARQVTSSLATVAQSAQTAVRLALQNYSAALVVQVSS